MTTDTSEKGLESLIVEHMAGVDSAPAGSGFAEGPESFVDIATALQRMEATQLPFGRRIIARARELGACLQPRHATAAERANAARFCGPRATLQETAALEFLDS
jgi:hypothetical protein